MNNVLIPTDYQYDTLRAMELTRWASGHVPVHVILLSLSPVPDSITGYLFVSSGKDAYSQRRKHLMKEWETGQMLLHHSVQLTEHHQYGASASVIQQIVERFEVNKIIIPYSFQKSGQLIHREALNAFRKIDCKITWMPQLNDTVSFYDDDKYRLALNTNEELVTEK